MAKYHSDFINEITARDFIHQATDLTNLDKVLSKKSIIPGYIGFDCTAPSLHVGSLIQIMLLRWFQKCGHQPIILLGGGTTLIGDPSGKDESRKLLTNKKINENTVGIKNVFKKFINFSNNNKAIIINNAEWLTKLNYINFLRDYGKHFSINRMLSFDSVKLRLDREQTLSFLEFNYMILQAYDFLELNKTKNCLMQMGGSDQWGNIVNGVDLIKRHSNKQAYGLTTPLITLASGTKMGKTESGAIWLDKKLLSPYDYWQFWRNTDDKDVLKFLKIFTDIELLEIEKIKNKNINELKILLANLCTEMLHGDKQSKLSEETAKKTFEEKSTGSGLPIIKINQNQIDQKIDIINLIVLSKLETSKSEIRRIINNNGVKINNAIVNDNKFLIKNNLFNNEKTLKLSLGKKRHVKVELT